MKRVGLFGTKFTMQGGFYQKVFKRAGMVLMLPDIAEQEYIRSTYMAELVNGIYRDEVRDRFIAIARELQGQQEIDGLVLGGTELPLLMRDAEGLDLPKIDTGRVHVEKAITELLK